ncbi:MAG TPA: ferrous iron transport protein B [Thermoplasmata archaeon]|nr:ferrous iron transport protein B [Thermoplasmata archaeon]
MEHEPGTIYIALVGNPNVGKSVIYNQLTGAHQIIGNWPGKTAAATRGQLKFEGSTYDFADLPGTYSISSDVAEERTVGEYIAKSMPDVIVNIIDASFLERNLALTLELLTMGIPVILSVNLLVQAEKNGISIDFEGLGKLLGVTVVPTTGLRGKGIPEILRASRLLAGKEAAPVEKPFHTPRIAKAIMDLRGPVEQIFPHSPGIWLAERLLAGDDELENMVRAIDPSLLDVVRTKRSELEREFGDRMSSILASDRFAVAASISLKTVKRSVQTKTPVGEKIHDVLTHRVYGLLSIVAIAGLSFLFVFLVGDFLATIMINWFNSIQPSFVSLFSDPRLGTFLWNGLLGGIFSVISIALPYLLPLFIILAVMEDSGYLARVAFVMDGLLHKIGLHGKAFIPILLGYSCNVPACMGCRIMETERERILSIFAVTLVPCAATTVVILGLVGTFMGIWWVLALYMFNLALIAVLVRFAGRFLPKKSTGLIMEMPPLRSPSAKIVLRQSWFRAKDFVYIAIPLLIIVGLFLAAVQYFGWLDAISDAMSPVTVGWLGLPAMTGILLVFGILRKELTLVMLGSIAGTLNFADVMTPVQMIVFTLVVMLYIPCVATVGVLVREIGTRKAATITLFEIGFAILAGGIAFRLLTAFA